MENRSRRALLIKNGRSLMNANQRRENSINESRRKPPQSRANNIKAEIISHKPSSNSVLYCLNNSMNLLSPRKQNVNLLNLRQPKYTNTSNHNRTVKRKHLRRTQSEYISKSRHQTTLNGRRRLSTDADLKNIKDVKSLDTLNTLDTLNISFKTTRAINTIDTIESLDKSGQTEIKNLSKDMIENTSKNTNKDLDEKPKNRANLNIFSLDPKLDQSEIKNNKTLESLKQESEALNIDLIFGSEAKQADSKLMNIVDQEKFTSFQKDLKEKDSNNNNRNI